MWSFPELLWGLLMIRPGISSTDTTSTIRAATQVVYNSEHVRTADIARGDLPDGTLYPHVDCRRGPTRSLFVRSILILHLLS